MTPLAILISLISGLVLFLGGLFVGRKPKTPPVMLPPTTKPKAPVVFNAKRFVPKGVDVAVVPVTKSEIIQTAEDYDKAEDWLKRKPK